MQQPKQNKINPKELPFCEYIWYSSNDSFALVLTFQVFKNISQMSKMKNGIIDLCWLLKNIIDITNEVECF